MIIQQFVVEMVKVLHYIKNKVELMHKFDM
jgi:hypothetical protein